MINSDANPYFERPELLFRAMSHFDIETHRFSGQKSWDGYVGGFPMMFDGQKRRLAVDPTDSHTLVIGASGSKKTRNVVIPSIKVISESGESLIVNDPKGEIFDRTGEEIRRLGYNVITLNFRNPAVGNTWNFMEIPYRYYKSGNIDKAAEMANDISNTIALSDVSSEEPFWDYAACDCCFGLMMLLFRLCREMNYPDNAVNISGLLKLRLKLFEDNSRSRESVLWKWASSDELIRTSLTGSVYAPEDTRRSILSVLDQKLRVMAIQPSLLDMMSCSNFEISDICKKKSAVFLIIPDEKKIYNSIVASFISQSYQVLVSSAVQNGGRLPIRTNYILDEFSSLPTISGGDFPNMISAGRSRNIRFLICLQSKGQLVRRYKEEANTIMSNCSNWICLRTRELELLREVSELCGEKRNGTPNASVYDLQHLSKQKNEALILSESRKPCLATLCDIDVMDGGRYKPAEFITPPRIERPEIDFDELPEEAKAMAAEKEKREEERKRKLLTEFGMGFNLPSPIKSPLDISFDEDKQLSGCHDEVMKKMWDRRTELLQGGDTFNQKKED